MCVSGVVNVSVYVDLWFRIQSGLLYVSCRIMSCLISVYLLIVCMVQGLCMCDSFVDQVVVSGLVRWLVFVACCRFRFCRLCSPRCCSVLVPVWVHSCVFVCGMVLSMCLS